MKRLKEDYIPTNPILASDFNIAMGILNSLPTRGNSLTQLGDSVTHNPVAGAKLYGELISEDLGIALDNRAIGGDMACDVFARQIAPTSISSSISARKLFTFMVGINDAVFNGDVAGYPDLYKNLVQASLTWLAIPIESKILPPAFTLGTGANLTTPFSGSALQAARGGNLTINIKSYGFPIYLWYVISDAQDGNFRVKIDGTQMAVPNTNPTPNLASTNALNGPSVALLGIPASKGAHTITIDNVTGTFGILGVGTLPSLDYATKPAIAVGQIPPQNATINDIDEARYVPFRAKVVEAVNELRNSGLDVRLVQTSDFWDATDPTTYIDHVHPSAIGHRCLFNAFTSVLKAVPSSSSSSSLGTTSNEKGQQNVVYFNAAAPFNIPAHADIVLLDIGGSDGNLPAVSAVGASAYHGEATVLQAQLSKRLINISPLPIGINTVGSDILYDFSTPAHEAHEAGNPLVIYPAEVYDLYAFYTNEAAAPCWYAYRSSSYNQSDVPAEAPSVPIAKTKMVRIDASAGNVQLPAADYYFIDVAGSVVFPPMSYAGVGYSGEYDVVHDEFSCTIHNVSAAAVTLKKHATDEGLWNFDSGSPVNGDVTLARGKSRNVIGFFPGGDSYVYVSGEY